MDSVLLQYMVYLKQSLAPKSIPFYTVASRRGSGLEELQSELGRRHGNGRIYGSVNLARVFALPHPSLRGIHAVHSQKAFATLIHLDPDLAIGDGSDSVTYELILVRRCLANVSDLNVEDTSGD